ncbi:Gfo/Idh/MocA family protein [Streptomyces sp. NPDC001530]|uniref:Gfo/Idh/MocA family protein n=1 Tax=Streptomyces sp. NPDC001530 TaxID=3364582 RepID=UPI0036778CB8
MPLLNVGVLGCAAIARRATLPALVADPSVRLVAVASRTGSKAEAVAGEFGCAAVTGYTALLDRADVDAVYIPLPPALRFEWVAKALAAGKHVLAEKPLCVTYEEARHLVSAARGAGLLLMENFAFLRHSQHATARRLIEEGAIGEPRSLTAEFGFPPRPAPDIRYQAELGGGALLDAGVYTLRAAGLYLGSDVTVAGASLRHDAATGVDLGGAALLRSPDGRTAHVSFGFDRSYRNICSVWGSEGGITLSRAFSPPASHRPSLRIERQDRTEEITLPADDQFAAVVAGFASTILEGGDMTGLGADILRQAALVAAVREAASDGGR